MLRCLFGYSSTSASASPPGLAGVLLRMDDSRLDDASRKIRAIFRDDIRDIESSGTLLPSEFRLFLFALQRGLVRHTKDPPS